MKLILTTLLLSAAAMVPVGEDDAGCDLKKVVSGFHCQADDLILLEKELVSNKTYYACDACSTWSFEKGTCNGCDEKLAARKSDKKVCKTCLSKPDPRELCEKKFYECYQCGSAATKTGKCEDCGLRRKRLVSRVLVEYACGGDCGAKSPRSANCSAAECPAFERPMEPRCTGSGRVPHKAP